MSNVKDFSELVLVLIEKHSTTLAGNEVWIDWDAIYSSLLDEGFNGAEASEFLDNYMQAKGYQ